MLEIVIFPYSRSNSSDTFYCCCWKSDFDAHGANIILNSTQFTLGAADEKEDALEDFKFNLQIENKKQLYSEMLHSLKNGGLIEISDKLSISNN